MRILHIITDTNIGGAGRLLLATLKNMNYDKFEVFVAVPSDSRLLPLLNETRATVIETRFGRDKSFELPAVRELCSIIKNVSPDIVHTHASLSGRIAACLSRVSCRIVTRHCAFDNPRRLTVFPMKQIYGAISDVLATKYIATADIAREKLIETGVSPKKITVIQNGSEQMRFLDENEKNALLEKLGVPKSSFVVVISARLEVYKGHKYLFEAFSALSDIDARLVVVGEGSMREELERLASSLGINDRVIFTGFVDDVAPYYNIADVGVNCSFGAETTPLAITEAMSVGVCNIVSDSGGNGDIITSGVDGIVVGQCDSRAIADAIRMLYENRSLLNDMKSQARLTYNARFSAKIMTEKLEEIYSMLGGKK